MNDVQRHDALRFDRPLLRPGSGKADDSAATARSAFLRRATAVSRDIANSSPGELVVVVPVTSTDYGLRGPVQSAPGASVLEPVVRSMRSHPSRVRQRRGDVMPDELYAIDRARRFILDS